MGRIRVNGYTREFRGRVGPHVFRRLADGSMVAAIRADLSHVVPTAAQLNVRDDFRKAARFAKRMLDNPATRVRYATLGAQLKRSPFALAIADWFRLPTVDEIRLARYHGHIGDKIDILASDDVGLTEVHVAIKHATTHAVLEEGTAAANGDDWVYTATTTLPVGQAVTIEVTAKDGTEHQGTDSRNYP